MTKKAGARGSARAGRAGRRPFVCVVRGRGIDVDIRVDNANSVRAIAKAVGDSLAQVLERVAREARGMDGGAGIDPRDLADLPGLDLVDVATGVLSGERAPDDAELDQVIAVLQRERDRRAEMRS